MPGLDKQHNLFQRSPESVDALIDKLEHQLPDVAQRAAAALYSSAQLQLFPAAELVERISSRIGSPLWRGNSSITDQLISQLNSLGSLPVVENHQLIVDSATDQTPCQPPVPLIHSDSALPPEVTTGNLPSPNQPHVSAQSQRHDFTATDTANDRASICSTGSSESLELWSDDEDHQCQQYTFTDGDNSSVDDSIATHQYPTRLPWIELCQMDQRVLNNTFVALKDPNVDVIRRTLRFLADVTIRDFPAEVFLQRPDLVHTVFSLISSVGEKETDTTIGCLQCLCNLTDSLSHRLCQHQASDAVNNNNRNNRDSSSQSQCSSSAGISVVHFCALCFRHAVSCLYIRHWRTLVAAERLCRASCRLLKHLPAEALWAEGGSGSSTRESSDLRSDETEGHIALDSCVEVVRDLLYWQRGCFTAVGVSTETQLIHRSSWLIAASLLPQLWSALRHPRSSPSSSASGASGGGCYRSRLLVAATLAVVFDESLHVQAPALHRHLLQTLDDDRCLAIWRWLWKLEACIRAAHHLLVSSADQLIPSALPPSSSSLSSSNLRLLRHASRCVHLHGGVSLPAALAEYLTAVDGETSCYITTWTDEAAELLAGLMEERMAVEARAAVFRVCGRAARTALLAGGCADVSPLLHTAVLKHTLCTGVAEPRTCQDAIDIISYSIAAETWRGGDDNNNNNNNKDCYIAPSDRQLRSHLLNLLPLLLCHIHVPQLSQHISHVLQLTAGGGGETGGGGGCWRLCADLLLTCHRSGLVRKSAWDRVLNHLLSGGGASAQLLPDVSQLSGQGLMDTMLLAEPTSIVSRLSQPDDLSLCLTLLDEACDPAATVQVRANRLTHLSVLLQDPCLHSCVVDADVVGRLHTLLATSLQEEPNTSHDISLAPACIAIFHRLALFSTTCRLTLFDSSDLLSLFVRVLLLYRTDSTILPCATQLILCLCLDSSLQLRRSVSSPGHWRVLLPSVLVKTFQLPFIVEPENSAKSAGDTVMKMFLSPISVAGRQIHCAGIIRSIWYSVWHCSLSDQCQTLYPPTADDIDYSLSLLMPDWQLSCISCAQLSRLTADVLQQLTVVTSQTHVRSLLDQLTFTVLLQQRVTTALHCTTQFVLDLSDTDRRVSSNLCRFLWRPLISETDVRLLNATLRLFTEIARARPGTPLIDNFLSEIGQHWQVLLAALIVPQQHVDKIDGASSLSQHRSNQENGGMIREILTAVDLVTELCCLSEHTGTASTENDSSDSSVSRVTSLCESLTCQVTVAVNASLHHCPGDLVRLQRQIDVLCRLAGAGSTAQAQSGTVAVVRKLCMVFGAVGEDEGSYMGHGILQAAIETLYYLTDKQECWCEEFGSSLQSLSAKDGCRITWLGNLFAHVQSSIRCMALSTALCLCRWRGGARLLARESHLDRGDIWLKLLSSVSASLSGRVDCADLCRLTCSSTAMCVWLLAALSDSLSADTVCGLSTASLVNNNSSSASCWPLVVFEDAPSVPPLEGPPALLELGRHWQWFGLVRRQITSLDSTSQHNHHHIWLLLFLLAGSLRFTHSLLCLDLLGRESGVSDRDGAVELETSLLTPVCEVVQLLTRQADSISTLVRDNSQRADNDNAIIVYHVCVVWREALRLCLAVLTSTDSGDHQLLEQLVADTTLLSGAATALEHYSNGDDAMSRQLCSLLLQCVYHLLISSPDDQCPRALALLLSSHAVLCFSMVSLHPALLYELIRRQAVRQLHSSCTAAAIDSCCEWLPSNNQLRNQLCHQLLDQLAEKCQQLALFLLVSSTAKQVALESVEWLAARLSSVADLIDGIVSTDCTGKSAAVTAKVDSLVEQLCVLRNWMSGCVQAKRRVAVSRLTCMLSGLWHSAAGALSRRHSVTVSVLCTLATMASGCDEGGRQLSYSWSVPTTSRSSGSSAVCSCPSMVQSVLQLCSRQLQLRRTSPHNHQLLAVAFSLLAAAVTVQEARNIICRGSFLSEFVYNRSQCKTAADLRYHVTITRLWLLLLKNVSFHSDGQRSLLKIPDVITSLVSILHQTDIFLLCSSMLVLRNLSFTCTAPVTIINTDGFIDGVCSALVCCHLPVVNVTLALLWRLLCVGSRVRTMLTSGARFSRLKSALGTCGEAELDADSREMLDYIRKLMFTHAGIE